MYSTVKTHAVQQRDIAYPSEGFKTKQRFAGLYKNTKGWLFLPTRSSTRVPFHPLKMQKTTTVYFTLPPKTDTTQDTCRMHSLTPASTNTKRHELPQSLPGFLRSFHPLPLRVPSLEGLPGMQGAGRQTKSYVRRRALRSQTR